jgi:hypothetical protein
MDLLCLLVQLAIDPTTTPVLARAITRTTDALIEASLEGATAQQLAATLASTLKKLPRYHQARAVVAVGQGSADVRTLARLLAAEIVFPDCLKDEAEVSFTSFSPADTHRSLPSCRASSSRTCCSTSLTKSGSPRPTG